MDFDQAIAAHSAWKRRLSEYLARRDGSLKPHDVLPDNQCPLGQWIYAEGKKYANSAEYSTLKNEHARFHRAAAEVVRRANSGETVSEEVAIGSRSEFVTASSAVVLAIKGIQKRAAVK